MNTIVMNTKTGAVSEHALQFHSLSENFGAGDSGLFSLGGDLDDTEHIDAIATTGKTLLGDSSKKHLSDAYLSMNGAGLGVFVVHGKQVQFQYQFPVLAAGVSRAKLGRGIKENYVAFTYQNVDGADFSIDRIEVRSFKSQRRV